MVSWGCSGKNLLWECMGTPFFMPFCVRFDLGLHLGLQLRVTFFKSLGLHLGLHFLVFRGCYEIGNYHKIRVF